MRKSAGFTLIELVIVIIILGILGAVAAPRLFNLQGDAYGANLSALRSSLSSAATMANAKAQLAGVQNTDNDDDDEKIDEYTKDIGNLDANIEFEFGYPIASAADTPETNVGILGTLDGFDYDRYELSNPDDGKKVLRIVPKSINNKFEKDPKTGCVVFYTAPSASGGSAKVEAFTGGC